MRGGVPEFLGKERGDGDSERSWGCPIASRTVLWAQSVPLKTGQGVGALLGLQFDDEDGDMGTQRGLQILWRLQLEDEK